MRYIIDKGDLYMSNEGGIILTIGHIYTIKILPVGCYPPITGRLIEVTRGNLTLDISTNFKSNVRSFNFKNILSINEGYLNDDKIKDVNLDDDN